MFNELWRFVSDPQNQTTLTWILGITATILAGIGACLRFLFPKGAKKKDASVGVADHSVRVTRHAPTVRTTNSHNTTTNNTKNVFNSLGTFIVLAVFAVVVLVVVLAFLSPNGLGAVDTRRACGPDLTLPEDPRQTAIMLNNLGNSHQERQEHARAATCYELALEYHGVFWDALINLARLHYRWEGGDRDRAHQVIGRLIDYQVRRMEALNIPAHLLRLDCDERNVFTGEKFSQEPWHLLAVLHYAQNNDAKAVAALEDLIAVYPPQSCIHGAIVAEARGLLGALYCVEDDPASAEPLLQLSIRQSEVPELIGRQYQSMMKAAGMYHGALDGVFGTQSETAFQSWIGQGCPGLAQKIGLRRYGPSG